MIKQLKIKNLKGIKEGVLDLFPLTILIGSNNSGKTTILEALFLAPNPFRKVPYVPHYSAVKVLHSLHKTLEDQGFAFLLYRYNAEEALIDCNINGENYFLKFIKKDQYLYVSTNRTLKIFFEKGKQIDHFGYLSLFNYETKPLYTSPIIESSLLISSNLLKAGFNYLKENWVSIINMGICRKIAEECSFFSSEKYKDITIEPFLGGKLSVYAYLEDGTRIRLGDLGEGIQSYIIARILYEVEKPSMILWDDIESHFNPKILLKISDWFADLIDEGKQIILTTHSLEAAKIVCSTVDPEKTRILLLNLEKNVLNKKELTLEELKNFLKSGIDVRVTGSMLL